MKPATISELNEFFVLDLVRSRGETSRAQIGELLDLSPASVSRIVRRLLDAGWITELAGSAEGPGRIPQIIRFNGRAGAVIAVDLGGTQCHGVLADLAGETLAHDLRPTRSSEMPSGTLLACIASLREQAEAGGVPVRAVVTGIPAVIDADSGLAVGGPNVDWRGFDLLGLLGQHVPEPLLVENDVNLAALGHAWRGEGRGISHFVVLSIGTGVGAAVVADGSLIKGRHHAAGEVGYLLTGRRQLAEADDGGLEAVVAGPAIARRAARLLEQGDVSSELEGKVSPEDIFAAAERSDPVALTVVAELADYVAMAIVDIAAVMDPERVILDGSVGRALEPRLAHLRELVDAHTLRGPEIVVSRLGADATVTGGIASGLAAVREQDAPQALAGELQSGQTVVPR